MKGLPGPPSDMPGPPSDMAKERKAVFSKGGISAHHSEGVIFLLNSDVKARGYWAVGT